MAFRGRGPVLQSVPDEMVIITLKLSGASHEFYLPKPVHQPPPYWRPAAGPGKCTAGGSGFALITTRAGGITLVSPALVVMGNPVNRVGRGLLPGEIL
jgi:hypothetical protein